MGHTVHFVVHSAFTDGLPQRSSPSQPGNVKERILPFTDGSTRIKTKVTGAKPTEDKDEPVSVIKDVVDMMGTITNPPKMLDECDHFGQVVAHAVRNVPNAMIRERTKLRIHELLFEARFGEC